MSRSRFAVIVCATLLGTACTSSAPQTAATAADVGAGGEAANAQQVAAAEEDPLVCRPIATTGTRVAKKVCMRQSEIDKGRRDATEMLGEVQRRGVLRNDPPE